MIDIKKIHLVIIVILFLLTGCVSSSPVSMHSAEGEETVYTLSRENCGLLFGYQTEELEDGLASSDWSAGNYREVFLNDDGSVSVVLNKNDETVWRNEFLRKIDIILSGREKGGQYVEINAEYNEFSYFTYYEFYKMDGYSIGSLIQYCGLLQMLNGVDLSSWSITISMIDIDTGVTVVKSTFPQDGTFNVTDEDWEKALSEVDYNRCMD